MAKAVHGWLTPDSLAGDEICRPLFLPANEEVLAIVGGALSELTKPFNYEKTGDIEPQAVAEFMTAVLDRWYNDSCGGGNEALPAWQSDDGSDATSDEPIETWYDQVSWWIIEAFLATAVTPGAAITITTTLRTLHLAFKRGGFGGLINAFLDDVLIDVIDTYSAGTPVLQWVWDTGDDLNHTLRLELAEEANPAAEPDPVLGGYRFDFIRKNIRYAYADPYFLSRLNPGTGEVETSLDGGDTWTPNPDADPRNQLILPPLDTADPRCDATERIIAYIEELVTAVEDAMTGSILAGTVIAIIAGGFAVWAGFLSLLWFLYDALATIFVTAGLEDLQTNFTSGVYDNLRQYLYCSLNSEGVLTEAGLQLFLDKVAAGESTTVENVIGGIAVLYGLGGLNAIASSRTETGDCSGLAACGWSHRIYASDPYWRNTHLNLRNCSGAAIQNNVPDAELVEVSGKLRWNDVVVQSGLHGLALAFDVPIPSGSTLTHFKLEWATPVCANWDSYTSNKWLNGVVSCHTGANLPSSFWDLQSLSLSNQTVHFEFVIGTGNASCRRRLDSLLIEGTGVDPFVA